MSDEYLIHKKWMKRAIFLASLGKNTTSPNPKVGAVILDKNGKLIYEKDQKLNERDYGDLVGLNKAETAEKFGKEQVHIWRRSYDTPPPNGESLKDVVDRVSPYFIETIQPHILNKKNVLIAAHGNSLRAIMIKVGMYKPEEISSIELPTGSPLCLDYQNGELIEHYYLD